MAQICDTISSRTKVSFLMEPLLNGERISLAFQYVELMNLKGLFGVG